MGPGYHMTVSCHTKVGSVRALLLPFRLLLLCLSPKGNTAAVPSGLSSATPQMGRGVLGVSAGNILEMFFFFFINIFLFILCDNLASGKDTQK